MSDTLGTRFGAVVALGLALAAVPATFVAAYCLRRWWRLVEWRRATNPCYCGREGCRMPLEPVGHKHRFPQVGGVTRRCACGVGLSEYLDTCKVRGANTQAAGQEW